MIIQMDDLVSFRNLENEIVFGFVKAVEGDSFTIVQDNGFGQIVGVFIVNRESIIDVLEY